MLRREIRYTGRVQGVCFRATARSIASGHDVTGWVRNERDGSVRLQIQGAEDEVDRCLAELARVMYRNIEHADTRDAPLIADESLFEIRQ